MDETYIKVKGVWKYLYRAVDKQGNTVDFLLTAKRVLSRCGISPERHGAAQTGRTIPASA